MLVCSHKNRKNYLSTSKNEPLFFRSIFSNIECFAFLISYKILAKQSLAIFKLNFITDYKKWEEMTNKEKIRHVVLIIVKIVIVLGCLYIFICSLSIMGSSFQILGSLYFS